MKAVVLNTWRELEIKQIEKPVPKANEALIKVIYGGVCGSDITVYKGLHPTATAPVVLCHEILGTVERLPAGYSGALEVGSRAAMNPIVACGECIACKNNHQNVCSRLKLMGIHINGGFEEYTVVDAERLVAVDESLPDETAALAEPFAVGYHVNKRAGVKEGDSLLITGAGTIGMIVGLVAKMHGARVVISEINPRRIQQARGFGFDVIDSANEDTAERMREMTGEGFDIVIDASASKAGVLSMADIGRPGGTLVPLSLAGVPYEFYIGKVSFKEMTVIGSRLYSQEDFELGTEMLSKAAKTFDVNKLICDIMPLDKTPEAITRMIEGACDGKILIDCSA